MVINILCSSDSFGEKYSILDLHEVEIGVMYTMNKEDNTNEILLLTLKSLLEHSQDPIFIKDIDLKYVGASKAFVLIAGVNKEEDLIGKSDYQIFDDELANRYVNDDKAVLESGVSIVDHVEPIPDQNGRKSYSSTSKYLIRNDKGQVLGIYGIGRDITAQMELEEERECRELSMQMFEDVLEADITENKMIRAEGSSLSKELVLEKNASFEEVVELLASKYIHADYAEEFRMYYAIDKLLDEYDRGIREFAHITYQTVDQETYRWTECKSRLYFSKISKTFRITTFLNDVDEEIRAKEKLKIQAETDALTGLLNRKSVMEHIKRSIKEEPNKLHALLFIDLDCFKHVNDNFGHLFGDQVLRKISEKLKLLFANNHIIGRVGGDEFLVLLKDIQSKTDVENLAKAIFDTAPFYRFEDRVEIHVTCSIGVSLYCKDNKKVEELYAQADQAMYVAKEKGKNRMAFYE